MRACSMGYGQRTQWKDAKKQSPGPHDYKIESTIDQALRQRYKQITFGISREQCELMGVRNKKENEMMPGPANYDTNGSYLFDRKITLKGR